MATRKNKDLAAMAKAAIGSSPTGTQGQISQRLTPATSSTIRSGGAIQKTPGSSTIRAGGAIQKTPTVSQPRVAGMGAVVGSTPSTGTVASRRTATTAIKPKGPAMPTQASPVAMKKKIAVRKKLAQKGLAKKAKRLTKKTGR